MCWKDSFFDTLFPIDERVISVPYSLKKPSRRKEYLDVLIPNRKKANVELASKILEKNVPDKVYKYRTFSEYSLANFRNDTIWATNPANFNDPFDSISIERDISLKELDNISSTAMAQITMDDESNNIHRCSYGSYASIFSQEEKEKLEKLFKIL